MSFVRIPETCVGCNKAGSLLTINYEDSHARFTSEVVGSSRRHIIVANRTTVNSIKFPFKICPQCAKMKQSLSFLILKSIIYGILVGTLVSTIVGFISNIQLFPLNGEVGKFLLFWFLIPLILIAILALVMEFNDRKQNVSLFAKIDVTSPIPLIKLKNNEYRKLFKILNPGLEVEKFFVYTGQQNKNSNTNKKENNKSDSDEEDDTELEPKSDFDDTFDF